MQEGALPPGVEPRRYWSSPGGVVPLARREVEVVPVARGLVGLDARAADPRREQAADGEGVVADELGVEPEAGLAA